MEIVFETVQTPTAFKFSERNAVEKLRYTLNIPVCKAHLDLELKHSNGKCEISVHSSGKFGFVKLFEFSAFSSWIADKKHPEMYREEFVSRKRFRHWHVTSNDVLVEVHNPKESPSTEKFSYQTPTQGVWDPLALFFVLKQRPFKKIGDSMALSILSKRGPLYAVARAIDEKKGRLRIQVQALQGPAGENFELLERKSTEIWYDTELGEIAEIVVDAPVMGRLRIVRTERTKN